MARLALELLLNIAARRHDAHVIGQRHNKSGKLTWRPHKTLRSTGKMLSIRIMPQLQAAIDALPAEARADGVLTFLVNDYGRPFASAAAFGNKFADWCVAAGLKPVLCDDGRTRNYRARGLRKAALRALAHAGATGAELLAVSGHSSLDQVQEYLNEVDQEHLAEAAMTKLANGASASSITGGTHAHCLIVSRIGAAISEPPLVHLRLATQDGFPLGQLRGPVENLLSDRFGRISELVGRLAAGTVEVF
ncbi:hypothetical protein [Bradyrhizobium sp. Ash2021]|uniref:hypothetical protein n=1 Tax=Bradyrhizobium sp. Ash2021 TaxID=2954771 RepID=UPI0028165035|nr:hypothetical protein [Bradyrhizobium sp. Ash2021]WMT79599.1 hypothetical protein NL528_45020 [Bradyrhizobium sp. Ash2021]